MIKENKIAFNVFNFFWGSGLKCVLSITASYSFSNTWLNPLAEPVTKKPPRMSNTNSCKMKSWTPIKYPAVADITTVRDRLNVKSRLFYVKEAV